MTIIALPIAIASRQGWAGAMIAVWDRGVPLPLSKNTEPPMKSWFTCFVNIGLVCASCDRTCGLKSRDASPLRASSQVFLHTVVYTTHSLRCTSYLHVHRASRLAVRRHGMLYFTRRRGACGARACGVSHTGACARCIHTHATLCESSPEAALVSGLKYGTDGRSVLLYP